MTKKLYLTWNEFHQDVKNLVKELKKKGTYNRIIAISRGGLIPAGIVAYELGVRHCDAVNMVSYDESGRLEDKDVKIESDVQKADSQTLIIDDLSDTGRSFQLLRKMFPSACLASVYAKPQGKKEADVFARALPDEWIVFPWDVE